MTGPFHADDDATPLTPDERIGLIPTHVTLRDELNELEQQNIAEADLWASPADEQSSTKPFSKASIVECSIMYGDGPESIAGPNEISAWRTIASSPSFYRSSATRSTGSSTQLMPRDELAVRFHHCLVSVHPFPNGNGRWSRLAADLLIARLDGARFTWGRSNLQAAGDLGRTYVDALHAADDHDIVPLIAFARS